MARKSKGYRTHRGWFAVVRRRLKFGKYKTTCKKITRQYCYTKRGKPVRCGLHGAQFRAPITRSFSRCIDSVTKRFALSRFCNCKKSKRR